MKTNRTALLLIVLSFNAFASMHQSSIGLYNLKIVSQAFARMNKHKKFLARIIASKPYTQRGGKGIIFPDMIIPKAD